MYIACFTDRHTLHTGISYITYITFITYITWHTVSYIHYIHTLHALDTYINAPDLILMKLSFIIHHIPYMSYIHTLSLAHNLPDVPYTLHLCTLLYIQNIIITCHTTYLHALHTFQIHIWIYITNMRCNWIYIATQQCKYIAK